jgi:chorismate synthase
MSDNSFGTLFRVTTWGESHGPAIGCVVDGTPPGIAITEADLQTWLDQRKPGTSRFVTQRQEPDQVSILSGVFEGKTTGTPISLLIQNQDARSKDYSTIKDKFRPGHADYAYWKKYRIRDYRGGGRPSARETAMRVAAGGIARKILGRSIKIRGAMVQMGTESIDRNKWNWSQREKNPFWCPDAKTAAHWEDYLDSVRKSGSSVGAVIEIVASGIPTGLGAAMMSINAVKGVEIGAGFSAATLSGEENADEMCMKDGKVEFQSNKAGGILGGISTGQDIVVRFAVKPTSSILTPRKTITKQGRNTTVETKGRHDPCVGIRAVPVGEAMMACVLADHLLRHRGQCG